MLYLTEYVGAGILLADTGAEIETKTAINDAMVPLEPQQDEVFVGPCQTCHLFEGDLSSVMRGPNSVLLFRFHQYGSSDVSQKG